MTPLEKERMTAALELCGCVQGLIITGVVPAYMVDYLQSRLRKFRKVYGLPAVRLVERLDNRTITKFDLSSEDIES